MLRLSKQIILLLIAIGLLWGFHSSAEKSFSAKNVEFVSEEENSESESEDLKFLSQNEKNFLQLAEQKQSARNEILNFPQYFLEVPVSPPNA